MEQFRQVGEVLGSIRAIMVFRHDIRINPRQCQLLADATESAFAGIAEEMRQHLRLEERNTKWKALEHPLKELHRVFRDVEHYIRQSLEHKDWWGRALTLSQSIDCVNLHLHNLLWCIPVVVEAIETVGELTGDSQEEMNRRRLVLSKKYEREWMESSLFQHRFGKLYLVTQDMCRRMDTAVKEDRWILSETISEKRSSMTKQESLLAELLTSPRGKILPISTLVSSPEYQVRRRLGSSSRLKEIQWMGESFALKHTFGEVEQSMQEISLLSSLSHPNVMQYMYLFSDEDKKECLIVMELMNKDLINYIKDISCSKRRVPIPLLVAVDVMLQIARGMEYLHSRKIYHGDLNPSNILVKTKNSTSSDGYVQVKISGLGKSAASRTTSKGPTSPGAETNSCIWYAPEVFSEQEQPFAAEAGNAKKYSEKADVYSFAMICFELLTGKVPFEDSHLQGEKMSRNIRTGRGLSSLPITQVSHKLDKEMLARRSQSETHLLVHLQDASLHQALSNHESREWTT
ncbi:hypothetical protein HPP92_008958 [Vanilla planifolia]|uniref:Protein kinase domain-containing protein n=1 Tax=Vanilla planifolia TaxID=51239 RepID=A0A835V6Y2_VANPL|nr:hypothetical protein HPP92_008958 [Vanilla planifolia]